jgi:hypothetical protein
MQPQQFGAEHCSFQSRAVEFAVARFNRVARFEADHAT